MSQSKRCNCTNEWLDRLWDKALPPDLTFEPPDLTFEPPDLTFEPPDLGTCKDCKHPL